MKCGIEIHQRIDQKKLFCSCNATMPESKVTSSINRVLHPAVGETGELDKAVAFESSRAHSFVYNVTKNSSCLVDLDEEPPHSVNVDALITALSVARSLKMFIPDELHVMRKTVIDGSNTGGFQRTMVVGLGTKDSVVPTTEGPVRVKDLELEEESARIIERTDKGTTYDLSGLGVPLIEIGTHADIKSPEQAYEVALYLGELLRLTGNAQRGIGTIRQDVNISVNGGARVEVKGFQELSDLPVLVRNEVSRQESLIALKKELTGYELRKVNVTNFFEVSKFFKGKKLIIGLVLPGFKGLLARKLNPVKTLGSELADYARAFGVKGMIHEDEDLSKYGLITEFAHARNELGLKSKDLLLVIADNDEVVVNKAIKSVMDRVYLLNDCVPEETRVANKDCSSSYARPLPGGARMYPETDVPLISVSDFIKRVPKIESKEERVKELKSLGLSKDLIDELVLSPRLSLFRELVKSKVSPDFLARVLITVPKEVKRRLGKDVDVLTDAHFRDVIKALSEGVIISESVPSLLSDLCDAPGVSVDDVIVKYKQLSDKELSALVKKVVNSSKGFGRNALMGLVMREARGKVSGERVSVLLDKLL